MIPHATALRSTRSCLTQIKSIQRKILSFQAYSFATISPTDSKPPIALNGLDGTYATALYIAAAKTQTLENTARTINDLKRLCQKDSKLCTILQAPSLNTGDKSAIIAELQKHVGEHDKSNTVKNFLRTVADYNRLGLLKGICEKFGELMSAARGGIDVTVISATVKPDIIGGLVVEIGDRTIDLSVSSRIAKMNKLLTETL